MKINNNSYWAMLIAAVVVAALVSSIVTSTTLTGNVIKVNQDIRGKNPVYTTSEVDAMVSGLKGSCQYVGYKDTSSTGIPFSGMAVMDVCQKYFGYLPKVIVVHEQNTLYNKQNCSPSYQIFSETGELLQSYKTELANVRLGDYITNNICYNAVFHDGTPNANYSRDVFSIYSGVLCCKN